MEQPKHALLFVALAGAAGACTVGPDYDPPPLPTPERWVEAAGDGARPASASELATWWRRLHDVRLDALVQRTLTQGLDVREAIARVREARAQRARITAGLWPQVNANASYSHSRLSEHGFLESLARGGTGGAGGTGGGTGGGGGPGGSVVPGAELGLYELGFDATWELDLFGRVRRADDAARADLDAAIASGQEVLVSLVAETVRDYVELRALQQRLAIAERTVVSLQDSLALAEERARAGVGNDLDVARAQADLAAARADVPALVATRQQVLHDLEVLAGAPPGSLAEQLREPQPVPAAPDAAPLAAPVAVLRRRPDVRRAERELAAATARIGVATADLYPRLTLGATFGLQSQDAGDLVDWGSRFWNLGPRLSWPLFAAGRIRANVDVQDARAEQALARLQRTVLGALRDVENALVGFGRERERRAALAGAVDAARRALQLAQERHASGVTDFLDVLDAQRSLYAFEDRLAQSEAAVTIDLVALYKALGGGAELTEGAPPR